MHPLFCVSCLGGYAGVKAMTRTIFPTLLDKFERRLLAKLSSESGCSRSAVIRNLIVKEVGFPRDQKGRIISRESGAVLNLYKLTKLTPDETKQADPF